VNPCISAYAALIRVFSDAELFDDDLGVVSDLKSKEVLIKSDNTYNYVTLL